MERRKRGDRPAPRLVPLTVSLAGGGSPGQRRVGAAAHRLLGAEGTEPGGPGRSPCGSADPQEGVNWLVILPAGSPPTRRPFRCCQAVITGQAAERTNSGGGRRGGGRRVRDGALSRDFHFRALGSCSLRSSWASFRARGAQPFLGNPSWDSIPSQRQSGSLQHRLPGERGVGGVIGWEKNCSRIVQNITGDR